jgi:hypothetical protein
VRADASSKIALTINSTDIQHLIQIFVTDDDHGVHAETKLCVLYRNTTKARLGFKAA